jgi:hypothetical protein
MYLTLDTTALLVADRRSARELAASRRRSAFTTLRTAVTRTSSAVAPLPAPIGRTPVGVVCRAA